MQLFFPLAGIQKAPISLSKGWTGSLVCQSLHSFSACLDSQQPTRSHTEIAMWQYKRQGNTLPYGCPQSACKTSIPLAQLLSSPVSFAFSDVSSGCGYIDTTSAFSDVSSGGGYIDTTSSRVHSLICYRSLIILCSELQRASQEGKYLLGPQA